MPDLTFSLQLDGSPAPSAVVDAVQSIEVESSVDVASVFRLRLGVRQSSTGDWTLMEHDTFQPLTPVTIRVANARGIPEALINGYVTHKTARYSDDPSASVLEVTGMDATVLMNLEEKVTAWPNMSDSAIASAIFAQYTLVARTGSTSPQLVEPEGTTTQRGTDIRFLRRLARRNGFLCYVQPEATTGLDQGFFQAPDLSAGRPDAVINAGMGSDSNVRDLSLSYDMLRPTSVQASGLDISTKAVQRAPAPSATRTPMGAEPALQRVTPTPVVRPAGTGLVQSGELQAAAQSIADESSMALQARGSLTAGVGILHAGGILNIRGVGRLFNGSYFVTRVTHRISRENGHEQEFTAVRNAVTMTGAEVYAST
ncbi:MAG: contractile injection system protein, VgrG/Pvc8 family [Gemmatimonadota bacterium]|jgi:uncharacterized protein involved in type VI secretion and phage assembly